MEMRRTYGSHGATDSCIKLEGCFFTISRGKDGCAEIVFYKRGFTIIDSWLVCGVKEELTILSQTKSFISKIFDKYRSTRSNPTAQ